MELLHETSGDIIRLLQGKVPESIDLLRELSCGIDFLTDFLKKEYLDDYISEGGSKIKFVTGRPGAGKTHFSALMRADAEQAGYLTVSFSAKNVWLHDFRNIYLEILHQCDIETILQGCADCIIREMGYDPAMVSEGRTFMDALSDLGQADALTKTTIREALRSHFTRNPILDNNFALCCSLLTGSILGHPVLESANLRLLLDYLNGSSEVRLSQLRSLGLAPSRITRYNARNMLRSLSEVVRMSGKRGILVFIDDMEILARKTGSDGIKYGKVRREDAYESIRQLIDDIDNMRHLMFFLIFDRELMDSENYGLKSYQALWMRIQSEIVGARFNRFADILDLDRLSDQIYTPAVICDMAIRLSGILPGYENRAARMTAEAAENLLERARYGGLGVPYLVNRFLVEGGEDHV